MAALLGYNNFVAMNAIRGQTYEIMQSTINMQSSRLEDTFSSTEAYMSGFVYDAEDIMLLEMNNRDTVDWYSALVRLHDSFDLARSIHNIDNFFLYYPNNGLFISATPIPTDMSDQRDVICTAVDDGYFLLPENAGLWMPIKMEGSYYLVRVIRLYGSYIGALMKVDSTLQRLFGEQYGITYFDFAQENGEFLGSDPPVSHWDIKGSYQLIKANRKEYLLIDSKLTSAPLYLTAVVSDSTLQGAIYNYRSVVMVILTCILCLLILGVIAVRQWVIVPVSRLSHEIRRLQGGDMNAEVSDSAACAEFREVNTAFNEMVHKIEALKIDIYEEQLQRQRIHMGYLKLQIAPHFLINCLNTIYQLTETGRLELIQKMAKSLSRHLRYTLSSGLRVPLSLELEHTSNYVELSLIRYPGVIRLMTECEPQVLSCTVIPLIILNFVENTIKYEVMMGKAIEIHISAHMREQRLDLCIWDTGRGFTVEILAKLQDIEQFILENGSGHIGISNVLLRARMLLGDSNFKFSNRPGAGAQIDISIPFMPYEGVNPHEPPDR